MSDTYWFLEGFLGGGRLSRLPINQFPFQVGRGDDLGFKVPSASASRIHAEITQGEEGRLVLRDNNSTNGTFVNRQKLEGETPLYHGDVIHFADFEVRLIKELIQANIDETDTSMTVVGMESLSENLPTGIRELQELLDQGLVIPAFQPIVESNSEVVHAYEILGRGTHPSLSKNPGPLFHIAESVTGLATHLSQLFRDRGIALAAGFNSNAKFFLNIHPDELRDYRILLNEMDKIRQQYSDINLVLEIHEKAASNLQDMKNLRSGLEELRIELAYDDFGAGQARLMELIEAPANYLKFDIALVRNIDSAPDVKRDMVQTLVNLAQKMGIQTLAEGLDRQEEVTVCKEMGFDFIQGFYFGKPKEGAL